MSSVLVEPLAHFFGSPKNWECFFLHRHDSACSGIAACSRRANFDGKAPKPRRSTRSPRAIALTTSPRKALRITVSTARAACHASASAGVLDRGSLNGAHIDGTSVPVKEPSTASKTEFDSME